MGIINKKEFFLFNELVKKNFSNKYKESLLGILWSVLQPLAIMALLTIIFSTLFGKNIENFPVYFLSGKCIFDFFNASTTFSMNAIKMNKNIIKRTSATKYVFILARVASEFINFIITLIILIGVMIATNATFYFEIIPLSIIPIISLIMMVTGIGLILSIVCVYFSDIQHIWSVIILMLMYSSAIFYPMDIIPQPFYQYMILNPVYWIIDIFRSFAIYGNIPNLLYIVNSLLLSSIILVLGIIIFKKYENKVAIKI